MDKLTKIPSDIFKTTKNFWKVPFQYKVGLFTIGAVIFLYVHYIALMYEHSFNICKQENGICRQILSETFQINDLVIVSIAFLFMLVLVSRGVMKYGLSPRAYLDITVLLMLTNFIKVFFTKVVNVINPDFPANLSVLKPVSESLSISQTTQSFVYKLLTLFSLNLGQDGLYTSGDTPAERSNNLDSWYMQSMPFLAVLYGTLYAVITK